jgi:hypothetical protein
LVRQADRHFRSDPIVALLPVAAIIARESVSRTAALSGAQPMWCAAQQLISSAAQRLLATLLGPPWPIIYQAALTGGRAETG